MRSDREVPESVALESQDVGTSNDVDVRESLERIPSSRSVFRTPSIIASLRSNEGL